MLEIYVYIISIIKILKIIIQNYIVILLFKILN